MEISTQEINIIAHSATEAACKQFMDWDGRAGQEPPFNLKVDVFRKVYDAIEDVLRNGV